MKQIIPAYYSKFQCIAADCPDSCCKEWEVDVDQDAAAFYRSLQGSLGDRLRQVLKDTEDGTVMVIEEGRCPMWRSDGLCRIQAELGHDALCHVCRTFPRLSHDYGSLTELGLELSCPEAARLILEDVSGEVFCQEVPGTGEAEDPWALEVLYRSRERYLQFLESRTCSLPQALAVLLLYGYDVQAELDGGEPAQLDPNALLAEASGYAQEGQSQPIFDFLQTLEILTEHWRDCLETPRSAASWPEMALPFARYLIRRYWLQAISDYDLVCRVKFIIIACLILSHLPGTPLEMAQLFSKEIENDPDNVEALLDAAYTCPAFTDVQLLSLLLN